MPTIEVEVAPGLATWSFEDITLAAGARHDIIDPEQRLEGALAAAVAAGVLILIDGALDGSSVESDDGSHRKREVAEQARADLFADRDRELAEAARDAAFDSDDESEVPRAQRVAAATADKLAEWEQRMAEAAQAAVERTL